MKFKGLDKLDNSTYVYISHKGYDFVGRSRCHPDDVENFSDIVGGTYAEMRATIKALKFNRKLAKQEYKVCENFVKACLGYKNFDKESPTARAIFRQLNRKKKSIQAITNEINSIEKELQDDIVRRDKILTNLKNKKDKTD